MSENLPFQELVDRVADETGYPATTVRIVLKSALWQMLGGLAENKRVALPGFGSFNPGIASPRRVRNPQTGQVSEIPARGKIQFRPAKRMKDVAEAALSAMLDAGSEPDWDALIVLVQGEDDDEESAEGIADVDRAIAAAGHGAIADDDVAANADGTGEDAGIGE